MFKNYPVYIVIILVFLYLFIPFLAPLFFELGQTNVGVAINKIYEPFCHQRVERSLFLFGKDGFVKEYSVDQLKELDYLPQTQANVNVWPEYYGHGYYGNSEIGFKVPLCIRDIALYLGFVITALVVSLWIEKKNKKFQMSIVLLMVFLLPMMLDGVAETLIEQLKFQFVPMWFVNDWARRIVTGFLFGMGSALYIIPHFFDEMKKVKGKK
ncbi:MAG TPA: DUF2085 domain-containing protein [Candidatus Dojkabacteria bacterium]|nr:DUF2085 domain-containing protein [Candidatus Dojkabacteria bacterium]